MIHVCYAMYDKNGNFSRLIATSIQSLYENTKSWLTVHILHDNTLSEENKGKFIYQARSYGQNVVFYNMDELLPRETGKIKEGNQGRFSPAAMYRLLLMHVLPKSVKKIIYLDCDTIINLDIKELYNEPVGENGVASVAELEATCNHAVEKAICCDGIVERENYFCSGVLLFDMKAYEKHPNICIDGIEILKKHPEYDCPDQDILNYNFSKMYYHLPVKYDIFVDALRLPDVNKTVLDNCIYHFAGNAMDIMKMDDI